MSIEQTGIKGTVLWEVRDENGVVKSEGVVHNLVTAVGDQCYAERGAGISSPPAIPVGMKLGLGSTAVAKTGAGAALVNYLSGSNQTFDGGFPTSTLNGAARRITYKVTYAAGTATTASSITEVVLFNNTNADSASTQAQTIARAIIAPGAKAAGDSLTVTWQHDILGA